MPFQQSIALDVVLPISGMPLKSSFQRSNIEQWVKKKVKLLMSSAGIPPFGNVLGDVFAQRFRSLNQR
jgi:hypothetical protein